MKDDMISRQAAVSGISDLLMLELKGERLPTYNEVYRAIYDLPSAQLEITLESAINYLHSIGWMQNHDRIITEDAWRKGVMRKQLEVGQDG